MEKRILVTGGAGFIGSHVCDALLARGYRVRVLDSLVEQVHGNRSPNPVLRDTELLVGDVRDAGLLGKALHGVDAVVHLAAEVGVGQSMYEIERYVGANDQGTAVLLQTLTARPVRRVVVASSMSVYGEGLYRDLDGNLVEDAVRGAAAWDPADAQDRRLTPMPTPESKRPSLASVYAISKFVQERLVMTVAPAYGMQPVALRLFNVFGPGQALSNPYTGVLAIFAAALLNGKAPSIFEDGEQRRDFVHVKDVARAFVLAIEHPKASGGVFNIGSGESITIRQVGEMIAAAMGRGDLVPHILGKARTGDIRHCFADIAHARQTLGFEPRHSLRSSLGELANWVRRQQAIDHAVDAQRELETRGLVA